MKVYPLLIILFLLLATLPVYGQTLEMQLDSVYDIIHKDSDKAKRILDKIPVKKLDAQGKAMYYSNVAILQIIKENPISAYENLLKARSNYKKIKPKTLYFINDNLITLINQNVIDNATPKQWLAENYKIADQLNNPTYKINCIYHSFHEALKNERDKEALRLGHKMMKIAKRNNLREEQENIETNLATVHYFMQEKDSSNYYASRTLARARKKKEKASVIPPLTNYIRYTLDTGDPETALKYSKELNTLLNTFPNANIKLLNLHYEAEAHEMLSNYQDQTQFLKRAIRLSDSIENLKYRKELKELESKYNVIEKDKENAELDIMNKTNNNRILFLLLILAVISGSVIIYGVLKTKKQKLLIAEKQIAESRIDVLLQKQEIESIDAMIAGQELERKKIASELHDDLGNNLTTVKLYMEHLLNTENNTDKINITEKIDHLLQEIYSKVRTISHYKRIDTTDSFGLIHNLKTLANTITESQKLHVIVTHYNVNQLLNQQLELNIFRIVQELLTNVIKHAAATEVSISLTGYDTYLDIIVEDDGKGFMVSNTSDGTGLSNIKQRVKLLKGTITVESVLKVGTTICIEIPTP